jgi:hypothetical protein
MHLESKIFELKKGKPVYSTTGASKQQLKTSIFSFEGFIFRLIYLPVWLSLEKTCIL